MTTPRIRCAIYTRKSSEEGLDQGFNSLDAQYEACAAFIASQKHEGWTVVRDRFDDGGISGGTLDRPALARLLAEIDAGRIAMVVVYKIDRLTRSLADFARLVERLETAGCSFVSVTQAFNTATSMGRLTLNVLLSFAQFEREVTAERIRDKIAASKRQGLWMGGICPLGYDPHPDPKVRELVINEAEAETVKALFDLYDRHGKITDVERAAREIGLRSKRHRFSTGREQGGGRLSTGQIHKILTNPVYRGLIRHKERVWPGRHPTIIDEDLWDRVQTKLQAAAGRRRGSRAAAGDPAPLTGKLRDETGDRLTPTHTTRHGRRFRYYVSHRLIAGRTDSSGWRLPGPQLDRLVAHLVADHLSRARESCALLAHPDLRSTGDIAAAARDLEDGLRAGDRGSLVALLKAGRLAPDRITLTLSATALARTLGVPPDTLALDLTTIAAPVTLRRRGVEARLVIGETSPSPDPVLRRTLADAHTWIAALRAGTPLKEIARDAGCAGVLIRTRGQLAFLSPRIQAAIRAGTQPVDLTLKRMLRRPVPLDWAEQERLYGV